MLKNLWGRYPWCELHGIDKIHPDDLDNFKKEASNCKVFECVDEDDQFITLKYKDKTFRVKYDLFKQVSEPKFHFAEKVELIDKNDDVIISDIFWHHDKKEHYYLIISGGKKKSKRYFESDFIV